MTATEVLQYLQREIHSTVAATVDDDGLPATCAIDVMDADENGLYFLTARGKGFYSRLKRRGLSAGVHRFFRRAGGHTAGKLPALRELPCGLPAERGHSGGLSVKNPFSHMICAFAATSKAAIGFADRHKK